MNDLVITVCKLHAGTKLINQFAHAHGKIQILQEGTVLGYIINVVKDQPQSAIISYKGDYFLHALNYFKDTTYSKAMSRFGGRAKRTLGFDTEEEFNNYWESYIRMKATAEEKHLYV